MKTTNVYSGSQAISMAKKIKRLNGLGVSYEIEIGKGIANEAVVLLSWDESDYETALEAEENEL